MRLLRDRTVAEENPRGVRSGESRCFECHFNDLEIDIAIAKGEKDLSGGIGYKAGPAVGLACPGAVGHLAYQVYAGHGAPDLSSAFLHQLLQDPGMLRPLVIGG